MLDELPLCRRLSRKQLLIRLLLPIIRGNCNSHFLLLLHFFDFFFLDFLLFINWLFNFLKLIIKVLFGGDALIDDFFRFFHNIFFFLLYCLSTAFVIVVAVLLDFRYFTVNSPAVYVLFFFMWGHVLVALSFFMSTFFSRTRAASIVCYMLVFVTGMIAGQLQRRFLEQEDAEGINRAFQIIPAFTLYRGLFELSSYTAGNGNGLSWDNFDGATNMQASMIAMVPLWIVMLVLSVYLGNVLPTAAGAPRHWLYFLPESWRGQGGAETRARSRKAISDLMAGEPRDVRREREKAERWARSDGAEQYCLSAAVDNADADARHERGGRPLLRVYNARKEYGDLVANAGLSISLHKGRCFGLLGPNGAGKSTLISMMSGLTKPTFGDVFVGSHSLVLIILIMAHYSSFLCYAILSPIILTC